jgi:hypothetical protein
MRLRDSWRRQWKIPKDLSLKGQVNRFQRSVTYHLNKEKNKHWSDTQEYLISKNQSQWEVTKSVM